MGPGRGMHHLFDGSRVRYGSKDGKTEKTFDVLDPGLLRRVPSGKFNRVNCHVFPLPLWANGIAGLFQ